MKPVISIVVPLFNKESLIEATLTSLLSQKVSVPFEIVVIDDGSTDQSAATVEKLARTEPRIRYFRQENGGPSAARNAGIDRSEGEWIMFMDADDLMLPGGVETLYRTATGRPGIDFACANYIQSPDYVPFPRLRTGVVGNMPKAMALGTLLPRQGTFIFRREGFPELRFDPELRCWEDLEMLLRCFRKKKAVAASARFVMMYRNEFSEASRAASPERDFRARLDFEGKSFWEKILLGRLLDSGRRHFPQLREQYAKEKKWCRLANMFSLYARILNRFVKTFGLLPNDARLPDGRDPRRQSEA